MSERLPPCPVPPDWEVCWDMFDREYPWIRNLRGCPQDPIHHAEGDVWIHTRMVCEALAALPAFRALDPVERRVLFAAALLHDVAKPVCTRHDPGGRITSRGHSRRGSIQARQLLWRMGVPFELREQVAALVRHHQAPYWLLDRQNPQSVALEISQTARCDHLSLLAEADVRGRICGDSQRMLDNVALFQEYCREQACLDRPRAFLSDHTRFLYFQRPGWHPDVQPHESFRAEVVMLSGLPGSGKDHWVRTTLPDWSVISLDGLRTELEISPAEPQGQVIDAARQRAREMLRRGEPFVWNATSLSRQLRGEVIKLLAAYDAKIRIVYLEVPAEVLFAQNRQREAVVPEQVMSRLLDRWEVPDRTEAHQVDHIVRSD